MTGVGTLLVTQSSTLGGDHLGRIVRPAPRGGWYVQIPGEAHLARLEGWTIGARVAHIGTTVCEHPRFTPGHACGLAHLPADELEQLRGVR